MQIVNHFKCSQKLKLDLYHITVISVNQWGRNEKKKLKYCLQIIWD